MTLTRDELIEIVTSITHVEGKSEQEIDDLIGLFRANVPHPTPTNLIYYENLSVEDIADKSLNYKPIQP